MTHESKQAVEKIYSPNLLDALQDELNGFLRKGMNLKQAVGEYNGFPFDDVQVSYDEVLRMQAEKRIALNTTVTKKAER